MAVNLVSRVQKILLSPNTEWDVIDKEPADIPGTLTTYVAPLVIASAVAGFLGQMLFMRSSVYGITVGPSMTGIAVGAILGIVIAIAMVYVFAFIVDALAPTFGAQKNFGQAFKVSAFSGTASWVAGIIAGILLIVPILAFIVGIAGLLYTAYLIFVGLPKLMKPAADKGAVYALASIAVMIVIYFVVGYIQGRVLASFMTLG